MSEVTAVVEEEQTIIASTNEGSIGMLESMSQIADVDLTQLNNGAVLVYKESTQKWTSTRTLDLQNVEGGEF